MEEIWTEIEESECFELSNFGNIRNKFTKVLKSFTYIKNGTYKAYCLNGKQYLVHRLVAKYFVTNPKPNEYNVVNHLDENTHNNRFDNLEWTNNKSNLNYSNTGEKISNKLSKGRIIQYDINGNIIKIWNSKEECNRNGFNNVKSALDNNSFNRFFDGYFWFKENELFDKKRYKPQRILSIYDKNNILLFKGTVGQCAKYMNIKSYKINNKLKSNISFQLDNFYIKVDNYKL